MKTDWPGQIPIDFSRDYGKARRRDPGTSKVAARKVKTGAQNSIIAALLETHGPMTMHEIAERMDKQVSSISSRFSSLRRAGIIEWSGEIRLGRQVWKLKGEA